MSSHARREQQLQRLLAVDLVVLDDLFLARRISEAAEILERQRYKRRSNILVTSSRVIEHWGPYLGDKTMTSTNLDRLMHRCHMLQFEARATGSRRQPRNGR